MSESIVTEALRISTPTPPPAPKGVAWIDADTAAARLSVSARQIVRRCVEEWQAAGLARLQSPESGGKAAWHVREDADPLLARVLFPDQIPFDLRKLPEQQRAKLLERKEILAGWYIARATAAADGKPERVATEGYLRFLDHDRGIAIARATLFSWHVAYRADGLAGLADRRGNRSAAAGESPFLEQVKTFYLSPQQPSKRACWTMASMKARECGWAIKEYRTACRYLDALPAAVVTKFRKGEDAYVATCEPSIERDYSTLHSNEQWVGDHHQFDVMVNDGGKIVRPWLTAWMDMRSRKILGWCIYGHDPNQNSILSALRGGCMEHGVPKSVYVDNGKDYDSYAFHGRTKQQRRRGRIELDTTHTKGILNHLGCDANFCWTYHGQSKPIERFFNTLEDRFGKRWPTYCGNSPENRPENHAARVDRGASPKLAEFVSAFGAWLTSDYHAGAHRGNGMEERSPDEVYAASWNGAAKRTAAAELLDMLLMKQSRPVKVTKNGIRWDGLSYGQYESDLFKWLGKEVYLRVDERDVTSVQVWTPTDVFICIAPSNARIPANATNQILREAIRQKKQNRKLLKDYHESRPRLHEDLPDLMIRGAAAEHAKREKDATPPDAGPASIQPIRTPLADQMPALRQAMEREHLRPASGQEGMSFAEFGRAFKAEQQDPDHQPTSEAEPISLRFLYEKAEAEEQQQPEPAEAEDPFSVLVGRLREKEKQP